jgi:hypothetical protein
MREGGHPSAQIDALKDGYLVPGQGPGFLAPVRATGLPIGPPLLYDPTLLRVLHAFRLFGSYVQSSRLAPQFFSPHRGRKFSGAKRCPFRVERSADIRANTAKIIATTEPRVGDRDAMEARPSLGIRSRAVGYRTVPLLVLG